MYNKKSNLWVGFSVFMLLALVMTGCSSASAGVQSITPVATSGIPNTGGTSAAPAATMAPTAMSTTMPAAMSTAVSTAMMPSTGGTTMPTAMSTAMPSGSTGTQPAAGMMMPTAASFTLMVGTNGTLGDYLTDQDGRTLYIFVNDTATSSACNGACATLWVPLIGSAVAGSGVTASMVGVVTRQDGNDQVSYNGHPLYYFSKDVNPEDLKGQGFGNGKWWVISPNGTPINKMLNGTSAAPAMPSGMTTATP